uniref:CBP1 n=1 Tax=Arundo donax TaxID=35708 RepID=A0A0A9D517_ARUDO
MLRWVLPLGAGWCGGDARAGVRRRGAAVEALRGVRDGGRAARAAAVLLPRRVGAGPGAGPARALAQRRARLLQLRRLRLRARTIQL